MPPRKQQDETAEILAADGVGSPGAVLTGDAMHGEPVLKTDAEGKTTLGTHDSPEGINHKVKVYDTAAGEVAPAEELPGVSRHARSTPRVQGDADA